MKRKLISVALAIVMALSLGLVTALPAVADDVYVGPAPLYTTIQDAIDAADPYDTIIVQPGTYIEDIDVNKPLTIISEEGYGDTAIVGVSTGYTGAVVISSSDVIFGQYDQGFTVSGVGQAGMYLKADVDNVTGINNFVISATGKNALVTEGGQSNHQFIENYFGGDAAQLVYVNGQASVGNPSVNVDFIGNALGGSLTGPALGQEATDSDIIANYFDSESPYALLELWGAGNYVYDNWFEGNARGNCAYFLDNTGTADIEWIWAHNHFPRGAFIDRPGSSLLTVIYANIQGGVNNAQPDDTLLVKEGYYAEMVEVTVPGLVILAESRDAIVDGGFWLQQDAITVDGFTVYNGFLRPGGSFKYAMLATTTTGPLYPTSGHFITNNDLCGDYTGVKTIAIGDGPDGSNDLFIAGNLIHGWRIGVGLNGVCSGHLILGNDVYENIKAGMELAKVSNTLVYYNDVHDNDLNGISFLDDKGYGGGNIVHYNNFARNGVDTGLVNVGTNPLLDAKTNWWDDMSGPYNASINPSGIGDAVGSNIDFVPWLTRPFETVLDENIAYFGLPLVHMYHGWNMLSTPIALDPAIDTWAEYIELGDGLDINPQETSYYFDSEIQWYIQVLGSYQLTPCDAIMVNMLADDMAAICYSPLNSSPAKDLTQGWNWVSLSAKEDKYVDEALASIEEVEGGLKGYAQVVSPNMNQPFWTYVPGQEPPEMLITKGYYVFMVNGGELGGFEFTPQTLPPESLP